MSIQVPDPIRFTINGRDVTVQTSAERTLLSVLRDDLDLTGTKYGCGERQCGACAVLVDGRPTPACGTPVGAVADHAVTTIEGLAAEGHLHPLQQAFLDEGAFQCGYCTPGMIMAGVALLTTNPEPTDEQIVAALDRHICRCGSYPRILRAVHRAAVIQYEGVRT
jgi:carbon-monoxide dehydrogenase small subunit